jgi:hypothetical protein
MLLFALDVLDRADDNLKIEIVEFCEYIKNIKLCPTRRIIWKYMPPIKYDLSWLIQKNKDLFESWKNSPYKKELLE